VQIELKRRGLELKEAFNQINRYQRHSFGANSALFQYVANIYNQQWSKYKVLCQQQKSIISNKLFIGQTKKTNALPIFSTVLQVSF
jgi:type I site-specific restriction-modification system R (restriction) subunit